MPTRIAPTSYTPNAAAQDDGFALSPAMFTLEPVRGTDLWRPSAVSPWPFKPPCWEAEADEKKEANDDCGCEQRGLPPQIDAQSLRLVLDLLDEWRVNATWRSIEAPRDHPSNPEAMVAVRSQLFTLLDEIERIGLSIPEQLEVHADGRGRARRFVLARPGDKYGFGEPITRLIVRLRSIPSAVGEQLFSLLPRANSYRFAWHAGEAHRPKR